MQLKFYVNERPVTLETEPQRRLLDILREDLGLTGTKEGCSEGECGACTVLLDGLAVHSCLTLAMIMSAKALLLQNPHPSEEEIRVALSGNLCRCSGYVQIIKAVQRAARELEAAKK